MEPLFSEEKAGYEAMERHACKDCERWEKLGVRSGLCQLTRYVTCDLAVCRDVVNALNPNFGRVVVRSSASPRIHLKEEE